MRAITGAGSSDMLTVITGAPGSGKSTYVKRHAQPGDIVIDFDLLARAFGSPVTHGHSHAVTRVTLAAWQVAIHEAISQHFHGASVWIVDSRPSLYRHRRYEIAGAHFVAMESHATPE